MKKEELKNRAIELTHKGLEAGKKAGELISEKVSELAHKFAESGEQHMAMKRCESGHYYDAGKHPACPMCKGAAAAPVNEPPPAGKPLEKVAVSSAPQPIGAQTVALMVKEHGVDPVVGWFVCVQGPDKGKDFRIRSEKNFIGRSPDSDVALATDETISRENHASVVFTPKKHTFKLVPGAGRGLVYLNGDEVLQPTDLKKGDRVELGKSALVFVPFAGELYDWDNMQEEEPKKKKSAS